MSSLVEARSREELEAMHTGSLMARRQALLKCEASFELSDQDERKASEFIEFKNTPEWQQAYTDLKQVLSQRENVTNKQERKSKRQAAAKSKR